MVSSPANGAEDSHLLEESGGLHKPLYNNGGGNGLADEVSAGADDPLSGNRLRVHIVLIVSAYLVLGVVVYTTLSGMAPLDALYFCVVTLTTVGYGDLSAHKASTKIFTCVYILIGVAMIGALLAKLVESLLDQQEHLLLNALEKTKKQATHASTELDVEHVKVGMGAFYFLLLVFVGAVVFMFGEGLSAVDALYVTVVSSSTVGYGDYAPHTTLTRMFAVLFLPLSTLLLAKIVSDYTEMKVEESAEARQKRILMATLTTKDYLQMDVDGDGKISPLEFLCRTLVKQEKLKQEDIDAVMQRFHELDRDNNGFVELNEIEHQ